VLCGGIGSAVFPSVSEVPFEQIARSALLLLVAYYGPIRATIASEITARPWRSGYVIALEQHWGGLDGFVNLCGFMHDNQPLAETASPVWNEIVDGDLNSMFYAAKAAIPLLAKGSNAAMVNASSGLAQYIRPGFGAYAVAKAGVIALTKTLALENAPTLRVNAVAPSAVDTAFLRGGTGRSDEKDDVHLDLTAYINAIPLKRIATPPDVVRPILFLLGEDSAYMTGQVLWINGGAYMP